MVDKNKLKENIIKMYLESENNRCFKCIYYEYHPARIGAPEATNKAYCSLYNVIRDTNGRLNTKRLIECMIDESKEE